MMNPAIWSNLPVELICKIRAYSHEPHPCAHAVADAYQGYQDWLLYREQYTMEIEDAKARHQTQNLDMGTDYWNIDEQYIKHLNSLTSFTQWVAHESTKYRNLMQAHGAFNEEDW